MTPGNRRLSYDDLFPSRFLHADELDGKEWTLTIEAVYQEKLGGGRKKKRELDTIVSFKETKREYVLNPTNGAVCLALWGKYVDDWVGHRITIKPVTDPSGLGRSGLKIIFYGSPELTAPRDVKLPGGLKEGETRTLVPTGSGNAPQQAVNPVTGEVAPDQASPAPQTLHYGDDGAAAAQEAFAGQAAADGADEEPPGRGPLGDPNDPSRPAPAAERNALLELTAQLPHAVVTARLGMYDKPVQQLTSSEVEELTAWAQETIARAGTA